MSRDDDWGTTGTAGVSMVGGILTLVGGALTMATLGAGPPLLLAGSLVGVGGALGMIAKNVLVGKKKSKHRSRVETAMDSLGELEEQINQGVVQLVMEMESMTPSHRTLSLQILAQSENMDVKKSLIAVTDSEILKQAGEIHFTQAKSKAKMKAAKTVFGAVAKPVAKEISKDVLKMSSKTFGKATGGFMMGLGAVLVIKDGVTITKAAMKLWKKEPDKAAEILRELAKQMDEDVERSKVIPASLRDILMGQGGQLEEQELQKDDTERDEPRTNTITPTIRGV